MQRIVIRPKSIGGGWGSDPNRNFAKRRHKPLKATGRRHFIITRGAVTSALLDSSLLPKSDEARAGLVVEHTRFLAVNGVGQVHS